MCLAQGHNTVTPVKTRGPSVSSQALYHRPPYIIALWPLGIDLYTNLCFSIKNTFQSTICWEVFLGWTSTKQWKLSDLLKDTTHRSRSIQTRISRKSECIQIQYLFQTFVYINWILGKNALNYLFYPLSPTDIIVFCLWANYSILTICQDGYTLFSKMDTSRSQCHEMYILKIWVIFKA